MNDTGTSWTPGALVKGWTAVALLTITILVGLGARLLAQPHYQRFGSDSFHYLLLARSLASGDGFESGGSQHPDLSRSPLFPVLIAATWLLTGDSDTAALALVALWSALLVVPLFFLARGMFGPEAALASLPLGALSCVLASGLHLYPTAIHALLFVSAVAVAWSSRLGSRPALIFVAGGLAGAAALARVEGLFLPPVLAVWIVVSGPGDYAKNRRRGSLTRAGFGLILVAGSLLVYGPYTAWASARLGRWSPAPPIEYVTDMRAVADRLGLREIKTPGISWSERARFTLTPDHSRFVLERYFEDRIITVPGPAPGATDSATHVPSERDRWWPVVLRRLGIVRLNLVDLAKTLYASHFLPLAPVVLGFVGLLVSVRHAARRRALLFLALMAATSLAPVASHVEPRFLFVAFALGLVVSAGGWGDLAKRLSALTSPRLRWTGLVLHSMLVLAVAVGGVRHFYGRSDAIVTERFQREVVAVASPELEDGAMLARTPYIAYWAEKPYRAVPLGEPNEVLDYARHSGARYLVLEGDRDLQRRPQLAPLQEIIPPAGFRLILSRPHPAGGELRLFELSSPEDTRNNP